MAKVGVVGVGNMGAPMVRCLAKAGHQVRLYDLDAARLAPFAGTASFEIATSLVELGRGLEAVITMVPDGKSVQSAALGAQGFAGAMASGGVIIDMSSSDPLDTRALAQAVAPLGLAVVDAPVSGGVSKAASGTLAIMAGGEASQVDRVAPILEAMGKILRTGPLGSGHAMKALNNYVSAAGLVATAEALVVGQRFGLDPKVMTGVLNASTGRNNTTENKAERYMLSGTFDSGFTLALMDKDVGMARRLAHGLGIEAPELALVSGYLGRALEALGREADHTAVYAYAKSLVKKGDG